MPNKKKGGQPKRSSSKLLRTLFQAPKLKNPKKKPNPCATTILGDHAASLLGPAPGEATLIQTL
jgi:hypothetical protein